MNKKDTLQRYLLWIFGFIFIPIFSYGQNVDIGIYEQPFNSDTLKVYIKPRTGFPTQKLLFSKITFAIRYPQNSITIKQINEYFDIKAIGEPQDFNGYTYQKFEGNPSTDITWTAGDEHLALHFTFTSTGDACNGAVELINDFGAAGISASYNVLFWGTISYTGEIYNAEAANVSPIKIKYSADKLQCFEASDGEINISATGGTAPYKYSLNGTDYQDNNIFTNLTAGNYTLYVKDATCTNTLPATIEQPDSISVTNITKVDIQCNGNTNGSVLLSADNGTAPLEYSIDGTSYQTNGFFNNLAANNYTIYIKDANSCIKERPFSIIQPDKITIVNQLVQDVSDCFGNNSGSINLDVTGGTGTLLYSLDNKQFQTGSLFEELIADNYRVRIQDENSCKDSIDLIINQPTEMTVSEVHNNASSCTINDGSIDLTANGGTPPYAFSIDGINFLGTGHFENLDAGTYSLTARDAKNCTKNIEIKIEEPNSITIGDIDINNTTDCHTDNGSMIITAYGGNAPLIYSLDGTNYQALAQFTNLSSGKYDIRVKDANNCILTQETTVSEEAGITLGSTTIDNILCHGENSGQIYLSASGVSIPLEFSIDDTNFQTNALFQNLPSGDYKVRVKDQNSCFDSINVTISEPDTILIKSVFINNITTCPGEKDGRISISASGGVTPIEYSLNNTDYQEIGMFENLAAGDYTIYVRDANSCIKTRDVVITQPQIVGIDTSWVNDISTCYGASNGSVTVIGEGGSSPLKYSIDKGKTYQDNGTFNNLKSGIYIVWLKDFACNDSVGKPLTVKEPPLVEAMTIYKENTSLCGTSDGLINFIAKGGIHPLEYSIDKTTYQLNGEFNNLPSGDYTVYFKDERGCNDSVSTIIREPNTLSFKQVQNTGLSSCASNDGKITLNINGGQRPFQYTLDNVNFQDTCLFENLAEGDYTVTVKDGLNCSLSSEVIINQISPVIIDTVYKTNSRCYESADGTIFMEGHGGANPLEYSVDNGETFVSESNFTNLDIGTFFIKMKDANGCMDSTIIKLSQPDSIHINSIDITTASNCNESNATITVTAEGGTTPYLYSLDNENFTLNNPITNIASGEYNFILKDAMNCRKTKDIFINEANPVVIDSVKTTTATSCATSDAVLTVYKHGGIPPVQFSIDGINYQDNNIFTGLTAGKYTAYTKDANGCIQTSETEIKETTPLNINTIAKDDVTFCSATNGSINISASGILPLSYSIDNGENFSDSPSFPNLTTNDYYVIVKDANNCETKDTVKIAIENELLIDTIKITDVANCYGDSTGILNIEKIGGFGSVKYSIDNGETFQDANQFTKLPSKNYAVVIADEKDCKVNTSATIIQPLEIVVGVASYNPASNCTYSDGKIILEALGGIAPYQYSVDGTNFQDGVNFNSLATGHYPLTIKDANSCLKNKDYFLRSDGGIDISGANSDDITCFGADDGKISVVASGGNGLLQYSIDGGTTTQNNGLFEGLTKGNYHLTVSDGAECSNYADFTIDEPSEIKIIEISKTDVWGCYQNSNATISINANGGNEPLQYSISDGESYQYAHGFENVLAGKHYVIAKDMKSCISRDSITINEPDSISFLSVDIVPTSDCFHNDATLTIEGGGGTPPLEYAITPGSFQSSSIFSDVTKGPHVIYIKDANNCIKQKIINVSQTNEIILDSVAKQDIANCYGDSTGKITIHAKGGFGGLMYSINSGINYQTDSIFDELPAKSYAVMVKDEQGCYNLQGITINQPKRMQVNDSTITPVLGCFGDNTGKIILIAKGGTNPISYSIDDGNTYSESGTFEDLISQNYLVKFKDAKNCVTFIDTVKLPQPAEIKLNLEKRDETCFEKEDGEVRISPEGGTGDLNILWSNGETAPVIVRLKPADYSVSVTDINNCKIEENATVNVAPQFETNLTYEKISCYKTKDGSIDLTVIGGTEPFFYYWSNGERKEDIDKLAARTYSVTVYDRNKCKTENEVTLYNPSELNLSGETTNISFYGEQDGAISLNVSGGTKPYSFEWSNGETNDSLNFISSGDYKVIVTDAHNCSDSETFTIKEETKDMLMPKAFSPNGDGVNDTWFIKGVNQINGAVLKIYNSHGKLMFESKHPIQEWDGKDMDGKDVPSREVYFYFLDVSGKNGKPRRGTILVLR